MMLKEIIDKIKIFNVHEVRHITDDYGELVFSNSKIDGPHTILTNVLGPPIKSAGESPSREDLDLTKDYGGIWVNQTLFRREYDNSTLIAMYWPWQDGVHVTLKMAYLKKQKSVVRSHRTS